MHESKAVSGSAHFQQNGFSILPDVFGQHEIEGLIESISKIENAEGVRRRGGVYAVRNLLELSPEINELAHSLRVRSIADDNLAKTAFPVRGTLASRLDHLCGCQDRTA